MGFKLPKIGKIFSSTAGTKPHAMSIAKAQSPKPAQGNVSGSKSPFHVSAKIKNERKRKGLDPLTGKAIKKKLTSEEINKKTKNARTNASNKQKQLEALKKLTGQDPDNKKTTTKQTTAKPNKVRGKVKTIDQKNKEFDKAKADQKKKDGEKLKKDITGDIKSSKQNEKSTKTTTKTKSRIEKRLEKTRDKGEAIADGKGIKTAAEQRKARRLKKRETRLKKRIAKSKGPAGYASAAQRKAVHASKAEKKAK